MNLAARFSTSVHNTNIDTCIHVLIVFQQSNLGELDHGATRRSLIIGNLSLLQVQSLVAGAIAGVASFALGLITKPGSNNPSYFEMMFMTASAMVSASFSSAILGVFMCALIVLCRKLDIDPDNIACPMASSTGDIVTLILLAACASTLQGQMSKQNNNLYIFFFTYNCTDTAVSTIIVTVMLAMIPLFSLIVWKNKHVKELLFAGWTPIILAMVISRFATITVVLL